MSDNEIRVVITGVASDLRRALDGAKGDLGGLKAAIKDVPDKIKIDVQAQTVAAVQRLRVLRDMAKDVPNRINIEASADTGVAQAKLRLLESQAHETERAIARAQLGSLISGGGGGGLIGGGGVLANPFGAGAAPSAATGLIGGAPAIAGVAGAATAVAGSAGAGILGAGAIGASALGVAGVGLGSIAAVAVSAVSGIKSVSTALGALDTAQQKYGASSKQAQTAQKGLNAAIAEAGPQATAIAKALSALGDQWTAVSQPAQKALLEIMVPALKVVAQLMPVVAGIAKQALDAIGKALQPVFDGLSSPAFKQVLTDLGDAFSKLAAPTIGAFSNLMTAFFNVAVAASPFLIQIAQSFERWTLSLSQVLTPSVRLTAIIGGLVSQLKSWWNLATSIGSLMITIFSAGAGTGQSLVNLLTGIVRQWNAWLNTRAGQEALTTFFRNSADLVKALVSALAPLIGALVKLAIDLMPTFTLVLHALTPVFNLAAKAVEWFSGLLGGKLVQAVAVAAIVFLPGGALILGLVALGQIISHLPEIIHALKDAWRATWDAMKIAFERSLSFILGGFSSLLGAIKFLVDTANIKLPGLGHIFGSFGTDASKAMGDAQRSIDDYRRTLDGAANKAKDDLSSIGDYHETARDRVVQATRDMISHVDTGIVTVDSDLGKEMSKLGVTVQQVLIGASQHPLQPKPAFGHAGGGLIQIGRAGEKGRDAIPMSVGGHDIVVGAGEQAAIFNSEQQQVMNSRLADIGGLPGLFSKHNRPHYMAGGGLVGNVGAMIAEANRVDSKHFPYVWGGGHGSFAGPYDCSGAVSDILHAGGVLNAPRVSGDFMSYGLPGPGAVTLYANPTHVYMSIDGKFFGTSGSNPGGGAGWFAGAPRPGFVQRHVGGSVDSIKTPAWDGPGGLLGGLGKRELKVATEAANQTLQNAMATSFSGGFGGGNQSENLANQAIGREMMLAAGFGAGQWPALQALWTKESGWDANAVNSSSGAYGIPQALGHGHPYALGDARAQIAWGLNYIRGRYGTPSAAEAHELAFNWYATGGAPGGLKKVTAARAARKPPAAPKHHHTHTHSPHAKFIPKDALKGLLSASQLIPDKRAAGYERDATVLDERFSNMIGGGLPSGVDDPPLVTLTDADVAAIDPAGKLGYQAGDQIVNKTGMVAGRFFGPGGKIQGGTWHPGASTRLAQIAHVLTNRRGRLSDLFGEKGAMHAAIKVDVLAIAAREARKRRIETYLHKSVRRAQVVKRELDLLASKNLAEALKKALSKKAIAGRLTDLRGHLRTVTEELSAERKSQAGMIPINRDPSHTNELEGQAANIRDSIAVETQLGASGSAAVTAARSAIVRHNLTGQLGRLELTNRNLGGKSLTAGTGGVIGKILGDITTLGTDRDDRKNILADLGETQIIPARAEIASYLKERGDIGKLANIQVRTPATADPTAADAGTTPTGTPTGPDLTALNALLATQLAQTQQALAISQSQFGVLSGFEPLLGGRLVGSFQSGIDFVPRTGVALVHRGETITPALDGPQGNRAAATVHTAQGPVEITLTFTNNEQPLVKLIDARMNQKALQITSDHSGQRARLLSGVRRP